MRLNKSSRVGMIVAAITPTSHYILIWLIASCQLTYESHTGLVPTKLGTLAHISFSLNSQLFIQSSQFDFYLLFFSLIQENGTNTNCRPLLFSSQRKEDEVKQKCNDESIVRPSGSPNLNFMFHDTLAKMHATRKAVSFVAFNGEFQPTGVVLPIQV